MLTNHAHRHPAAIARDLWHDSKPGLNDAATLGKEQPNYYLQNRLDRAFADGWNAAERHYGHIIERLEAAIKAAK